MNRNKTILSGKPVKKKWMAPTALALAAIMGVTTIMTTPVYAANKTTTETSESSDTGADEEDSSTTDGKVTKDETVYVVADAKGNKKTVTVSDQLKGAGDESTVKDSSTLSDIQNTKGDETYDGSGDDMTWNTDGEDIYYQGTSDQDLPVNATFTYYLDGEEIDPKDLVGKSGKVTIDIEYTNNTSEEITVDGAKVKTKVPFVMATALFMPSEKFSNITIDNGKIIDDGSKSIVVGFGMPGLSDALDLDYVKNKTRELDADNLSDLDDADIPESVEITADVKDFELDSTYTIATSDVFSDVDLSDISSLSDIDSKVDELEDATLQLVDGSKELSDGTNTLNKNYADLDSGIADLQKGIKAYTDGVSSANAGAGQIASGANSLAVGITTYTNGVVTAKTGADQLTAGANDLNDGLKKLTANNDTLNGGAAKLDVGIGQVKSGATTLQSGLSTYTSGVATAADGASQLSSGINTLNEKIGTDKDSATEQVMKANGDTSVVTLAGTVNDMAVGLSELNNSMPTDETLTDMNSEITNMSNLGSAANKILLNTSVKTAMDAAMEDGSISLTEDEQKALHNKDNILSGAGSLSSSASSLVEMKQSIDKLSSAADGLKTSVNTNLIPTVNNIASKTGDLSAGLTTLADNNNSINTGVATLVAGSNQLADGSSSLKTGIIAYTQGASDAATGATKLAAGSASLQSGLGQLTANNATLTGGASQLSSGTATLSSGIKTLNANSAALNSGAVKLKNGSTQVKDGISELNTGAKTLSDGMKQYYDEAIQPIVSNLKSLSGTVDRMDALKNGDLSYDNFSGISDDMDGTVKFVITTESIKADTK